MEDQFPFFFDSDLDEEVNKRVNMEIMKYAGIYILKKLDLPPEKGGYKFEVPLMGLDEHLEPIMDDLQFHDLIDINVDTATYELSPDGIKYVGTLIEEIEGYIAKYKDFDPDTKVNLMKRDRINPLRARFLWGLYDGEFDDFDKWQEDWDIHMDERISDWREIITMKEFYDMLFEDVNNVADMDDDSLNQVLKEAEEDRQKERAASPQVQITRIEGNSNNGGNGHHRNDDNNVDYYYHDPYYFNPVYDPLFWYMVF